MGSVLPEVTDSGTLAKRPKVTIPGMGSGDRSWESMQTPIRLKVWGS
jgi:hypothetical protein